MPDIRVEFHCEKCGGRLSTWMRQTPDSMADNLMDLASEYCGHNDRHLGDLRCRNCQQTVVYDDVIYVEHAPAQGPYSDVIVKTGKQGSHYFAIGADTMDAICAAWQKYRG